MFIVGVGKQTTFHGGLHQILVYMPAVRQSDGNVVIVEKLTQRHEPSRSKPQDKNCGILQKMQAQATLHLGVLKRVHHQFAGFGVPVKSVTEFLYLRETALCLVEPTVSVVSSKTLKISAPGSKCAEYIEVVFFEIENVAYLYLSTRVYHNIIISYKYYLDSSGTMHNKAQTTRDAVELC
jgi:hypothetical protein